GDLVTMRWWNDLWLNESFATYMAYLAMEHATRWRESAWSAFHARMKAWAYEQDQLPTTHPIAGEVPDTDATFLNFDGITYGKGAAVLKQLVAFIGADGFRDGMRDYFRTHAWGNTTLTEFLAALERGSGRELGRWSELWLESAGVNTIAPQWDVAEGSVNSFTIQQTAPAEHPTLRPHRTEIAVYDRSDAGPQLRDAQPVDIDGASTVIEELSGMPAPAAVFPNHDDHAFAKIALDERSLEFVRAELDRFPDGFQRLLLWHTLWDMVRDQQFSAADYAALATDKLGSEQTLEIAQTVAYNALHAVGSYLPDAQRLESAAELYRFSRAQLFATSEPDFRIMWSRVMIGAAQDVEHITESLALVDGGTGIDGFELDQDMRWSLVTKATAYGVEGGYERLEAELERDGSDRGRRAAERIHTSRADAEVKAEAWTRYQENTDVSLQMLTASMHGFWWKPQAELLAPYIDRFFDDIEDVFADKDKEYASRFFGALYPAQMDASDHVIERSESVLDELGADQPVLARQLREAVDEARRARACQEFAASQRR
ncbi:MAG: ERAP1-like C-terminal domain-containing protein, partial [Chloroflexi bacterium]|nr:ERAP1-like C-terminal domain-containing protein [Chloroflexota bacterium]